MERPDAIQYSEELLRLERERNELNDLFQKCSPSISRILHEALQRVNKIYNAYKTIEEER